MSRLGRAEPGESDFEWGGQLVNGMLMFACLFAYRYVCYMISR